MQRPKPYQWDYDRAGAEVMISSGFRTFSIGVFQWLPKASGKGLKRSTTIRVNGYVADPQRAFDRADELCRQLNAENVRSDNPPAWLQKQYSVPRPADVPAKRPLNRLSGSQVRTIRDQVMREELLPLGFIKLEGGTYVRRRGEQIHLINFQGNKYGGSFTVNLAFHYAFVPPPYCQGKPRDLTAIRQTDCMLRTRLGHFLPEKRDTWFEYGNDRPTLRQCLIRCASESVILFDTCGNQWADPGRVLAMIEHNLTELWHCTHKKMTVAVIEMHLGRFASALDKLDRWFADSKGFADPPLYEKLKTMLLSLQAEGTAGTQDAKQTDRVTKSMNWFIETEKLPEPR